MLNLVEKGCHKFCPEFLQNSDLILGYKFKNFVKN